MPSPANTPTSGALSAPLIVRPSAPIGASAPTSRLVGVCCPACSAPMTLRVARRGRHSGSKFFGCTRYPKCRGTRSVASVARLMNPVQ
ncbi:topoisomerase DNA-binding C4 zinc finger domain-containing protein [Roseomonas sp. GC11]|uniref:topoisomerase DNA-binding C4 zinc finger domain-containing protein n=1 Tax=Roseomonas sp. GC11 TaxID=2950546 RepID=UPI00351F6656